MYRISKSLLLILAFFTFLFVLNGITYSQSFNFEKKINPFTIFDQHGTSYEFALFGGYNRPVQQFIDIDGDNDADLFIQDKADQLIFFRNSGSASNFSFEWITDNFADIQVGSWFKFSDADNDSDFDLFTENKNSFIRYYRNDGSAQNPNFVKIADSLKDDSGNAISLGGFSVPEWTDIDGDSELELFYGLQDGRIAYFEFSGLDLNNIPVYSFVTDTFAGLQILTGGGEKKSNLKHGANSLSFADSDNDNDPDLFWGDFFAPSIIYIENTGNGFSPNFNQDDIVENFPPTHPLSTGGFNIPRFTDLNNDGDFDMFVGIIGGSISILSDIEQNFYYYENIGTANQFNFQLQTKNFISGIDIGQNTIPVLVDIDADNDKDLFIANELDLNTPQRDNSRIYFYENIGTDANPMFQLADTNYLEYDKRFDTNYSPAFVDIDNDNDYDLFLGKWDGKLTFYRNDGNSFTPNFTRISESFESIDVGQNSTPAFVDIDNDQDYDLFIGEYNGNLNFYRNTGDQANPSFTLDTTHFFGIDVGEFCYPYFIDIDEDADYDLFFGSDSNGIVFYRNTGTASNANFTLEPFLQDISFLRSSPNFIDMDNDGDLDLFSGTSGGGLTYYENLLVNSVNNTETNIYPEIIQVHQNYPNPFNPITNISFELHKSAFIELNIFNILGKKIFSVFSGMQKPGKYDYKWNASNWSSGVYFYQLILTSDSRVKYQTYKKMIYLK